MGEFISSITGLLLKAGIIALVANEVRGFILAAPVLYQMYAAGGTWMAMWIGLCSLAGIAVSVVAPMVVAKWFKLLPAKRARSFLACFDARRAIIVQPFDPIG